MKNKLYIIFIIFISLLYINVVKAEELLKYENTYQITNNTHISSIELLNNNLYTINNNSINTSIVKLSPSFEEISSKQLNNLTNAKLIKYNENILIVGIENNVLKSYLIDENLQVLSQTATSYIINNKSNINLYSYNNKIYILLLQNENLLSTNIYEIDEKLNISENSFSSYDSEYLKNILKGDYYLVRMNDEEKENQITHYFSTTYNKDYSILVGTTYNNLENNYSSTMTIYNSIEDKFNTFYDNEYLEYLNVKLISNKIVILAKSNINYSLLIYDFNGTKEQTISLSKITNPNKIELYKKDNKLIINTENQIDEITTINNIEVYTFTHYINTTDNILGTINVTDTALSNEKVELEIIPNSGYKIDTIEIIDSQGNIINLENSSFTMPEDDVYINVKYISDIKNPETVDIIIIIAISAIIAILISVIIKKKLKWLE